VFLGVLQVEAEAEEALEEKLLAAARWETAVRWEKVFCFGAHQLFLAYLASNTDMTDTISLQSDWNANQK
jgi:hypothetical protein